MAAAAQAGGGSSAMVVMSGVAACHAPVGSMEVMLELEETLTVVH